MVTISLCMIVKNEEACLARCLHCVKGIADEIIIADTGSTDKTKEIASDFTQKLYDFPWTHDFAAARNFAFDRATMDYILWLDADDILLGADQKALLALKETLSPDVDAVMMPYHAAFDEEGRPIFHYYRERLVKRECRFRWKEPVHEHLEISGNILTAEIAVTHAKPGGRETEKSDRNLKIYEAILAKGESLSPRGSYYYARELREKGRYREAAEGFARFIDSGEGWVEDVIAACGDLAGCLLSLGEDTKALFALFKSFAFDLPRPEICCQIGYYFKDRGEWEWAAYWFEQALRPLSGPQRGFIQADCRGYVPCIECAVCFDRLGEREKAEEYNEKAAAFKPDSPSVLYNRKYFASLKYEQI